MTIIHLPLPLYLGRVNCYLVEAGDGFILIDTGGSNGRGRLLRELERRGCRPGRLKLIVLTHGDFDHIGSAAYLRSRYGVKLAMHAADWGMAQTGNMFAGRKTENPVLRAAVPLLFGFGRAERFTPDMALAEGSDLADYGLAARVIEIPGHSLGSIGVLTAGGDLFSGDLFDGSGRQVLNDIMDDLPAAQASLERLKALGVRSIYPGHGAPFPLSSYTYDK